MGRADGVAKVVVEPGPIGHELGDVPELGRVDRGNLGGVDAVEHRFHQVLVGGAVIVTVGVHIVKVLPPT